jgi:hypothetical protein
MELVYIIQNFFKKKCFIKINKIFFKEMSSSSLILNINKAKNNYYDK